MNYNDQNPTNDPFRARLSAGLDHIASTTPAREPGQFDPNAVPLAVSGATPQRTGAYLIAAAAVAALTVTGLVSISGRTEQQPAQADQTAPDALPATTPAQTASTAPTASTASTASTTPQAVRGVPVCGAELPVTIDIPTAIGDANPGPAKDAPTGEGQLAQHWNLPGGTIEFRWPADAREIYDLDAKRGNRTAFDRMTIGIPEDGTQAIVKAPNIDARLDEAEFGAAEPDASAPELSTMTMTATNTAAFEPPCNIMQVRYIDLDGNQLTLGYNTTDFNTEPSFGIDLNPLITSSADATSAPDAANTAGCGDSDINGDVAGPAAGTPADALAGFLQSEQAPAGYVQSGYAEFKISDNEVDYAVIIDGNLITLITVNQTDSAWAATHVTSAGC
ncbi:hypothetical protein [Ilumatobacter sp.]|uniref:hypothetical protein n=1 Tax=Ilumatobacter sp. TaxID=1967498 RepID=UPI003C57E773